jgi:hypothetical protein
MIRLTNLAEQRMGCPLPELFQECASPSIKTAEYTVLYSPSPWISLSSATKKRELLIFQTASRSAIFLKNCASFVDGRQFRTTLEITSLKRETPRKYFGKSVTRRSRFVLGGSFMIFGIATCPMYASAPLVMTTEETAQFSRMHSGTANKTISNKKYVMMSPTMKSMTMSRKRTTLRWWNLRR